MLSLHGEVGFSGWKAWNEVGYFASGDFVTTTDIEDGDDRVTLDDFPANLFAGEVGPPAKTPVGLGQRLTIDPSGENITIQIKQILVDSKTIIFTKAVSVAATITAGADVQFPPPLSLFVGDCQNIQVIGFIPGLDGRGTQINGNNGSGTDPNLDIILEMAESKDGVWHVPDGLLLPSSVNMSDAAPDDNGRITSGLLCLPPLPYLRARINTATVGAVFSLTFEKSRQ